MESRPFAIDPEELRQQAEWVKALARRLVTDEHVAEDLAQETWLAALQHPPDSARPPRPWLSAILRNFTRRWIRGESQRVAREQVAAVAEETAPTVDVVGRVESVHLLVDAVLSLEEPNRTTILLRYYEGLSAAEIARRTSASASTVRSRLQRGLESLRAHLDAEHDGDRRAWCLAMLPMIKAPAVAATAGSMAALTGGLVMSGKVLVTAGAAILVGASVLIWQTRVERDPDGEPPARAVKMDASAAEATEMEAPESPERRELPGTIVAQHVAARTAPWPTGGIAGHVRDAGGQAIAEATVTLEPWPGAEELLKLRAAHEAEFLEATHPTTTDAEGSFSFPAVPAAGQWLLLASSPGTMQGLEFCDEVCAGEVARFEFTLYPGGTVSGRVIDTAQHPVAGVKVWAARAEPVETGPDGRFLLTGVARHAAMIWATREGLAAALPRPKVVVAPGEEKGGIEIVMHPDLPIRGRVLGAGGAPVQGAAVTCGAEFGDRSLNVTAIQTDEAVETDKDGRFILSPLPDLGTYCVRVKLSGHSSAERKGVKAGATIEIELGPAGCIDVMPVMAETGEALKPAFLVLEKSAAGGVGWYDRTRLRPEDDGIEVEPGRYSIPYEGSGRYRVRVEVDEFASGRTPVLELMGNETVGPLVVTLDRGGQIRGVVVRATSREPVSGASILLLVPKRGRNSALAFVVQGVKVRSDDHPMKATTTDAEGEFLFDGLNDGPYLLRVEGDNLASVLVDGIEVVRGVEPDPLRIEVPVGGAVIGRVIGLDGKPAVLTPVVAHQADGVNASAVTGNGGDYRIGPLSAGSYKVEVGDPSTVMSAFSGSGRVGFSVGVSTSGPGVDLGPDLSTYKVEVRDGRETRVDHDLRLVAGAIIGTVLVNGRPRMGLWVHPQVVAEPGQEGRRDPFAVSLPRAQTDQDGVYRLAGVTPGVYDLKLMPPSRRGTLALHRVEVAPGREQVVDIRIDAARLRGVVVDADSGAPVEGAAVWVVPRGESQAADNDQKAVTDARSAFNFDLLLPGEYSIEAQSEWGASKRERLSLSAGEDRTIRLVLEQAGAVRVQLLPEGWSLADLRISLKEKSTEEMPPVERNRVAQDGTLLLRGIRPGSYNLTVEHRPLGRTANAEVTVERGKELFATMTLMAEDG
ncbi:MAG: sigma-70 family RNA polymerase sigma factor [Planctomycetota bacterium]